MTPAAVHINNELNKYFSVWLMQRMHARNNNHHCFYIHAFTVYEITLSIVTHNEPVNFTIAIVTGTHETYRCN